jgi:DNA-binding XRE family transcriptional regulator
MDHPLAVARRRANLSQTDLAREAEISRQTVIRIEKRRQTPSMGMAAKIIGVLRARDIDLPADVFLPERAQ